MSLFVDAPALVAIIGKEPDGDSLARAMTSHALRLTSPIALWETARALAHRGHHDVAAGIEKAQRYCTALGIEVIAIGIQEAREAAGAQDCYGEGNHPARLNMGDCFAYACAKTHGAQLLYKSNDFVHTDLA